MLPSVTGITRAIEYIGAIRSVVDGLDSGVAPSMVGY